MQRKKGSSSKVIGKLNPGNVTCMCGSLTCNDCTTWFDPSFKGGYCDRKEIPVSANTPACGDISWK